MSFYTIDGRFVNKKNVVEGFFDNRVIEHATIGIDNQEETEYLNQISELQVYNEQLIAKNESYEEKMCKNFLEVILYKE